MVQTFNSRSIPAPSQSPSPGESRTPLGNQVPVSGRRDAVRFAHPAETVIADLLDTHGIDWLYEPTTFALESTADGRPIQSFTPDFYLPECDTYIEMTTMRQSLVTRKNRKFRLLRELYPDLNVRLLYRRDVELISMHYQERPAAQTITLGPVLISEETIQRRLRDMVTQLVTGIGTESVTVIGLGEGARRFATNLTAHLSESLHGVSRSVLLKARRGNRAARRTEFGLSAQIDQHSRIILAADVVGTGLTAMSAIAWLAERDIPVHELVTLADRKSARLVDLPVVSTIVSAPSTWLAGYGIAGSNAPDIHLLED